MENEVGFQGRMILFCYIPTVSAVFHFLKFFVERILGLNSQPKWSISAILSPYLSH